MYTKTRKKTKMEVISLVKGMNLRACLKETGSFNQENELVFEGLNKFPKLEAYPVLNGWIIAPEAPWKKAVSDFAFYFGKIKSKKTLDKILKIKTESWSIYDPDSDLEGKEGFYFLRPSHDVNLVAFGGKSDIPTGWVARLREVQVEIENDFPLIAEGLTFKYWNALYNAVDAGVLSQNTYVPSFIMSAKITPQERYITIRSKKDYSSNPSLPSLWEETDEERSLNTAIKTGREVFWEVKKPVRRTQFPVPAYVMEQFGMPAEIFLPSEVDDVNRIIKIFAPAERCICCGKPLMFNGKEIAKAGVVCEDCFYTAQDLQTRWFITPDMSDSMARVINKILADPAKYATEINEIRKRLNNL